MSGGTAAQTGELPVASTRPRELARTRELPLRGGRARRPAAVAAQTGELPVGAVAPTLADLERALCRDRSNVVIAAPPSAERSVLVKALPRRLEGPLRVVSVVLGDVSEDRLEATLLGALASTSAPGAEPPERLLELARELERGGSALLVVVEDAEGLTPPVLARLGELSRASRGLRLALFAGPGGPGDDGFFARLVAALGVGAQKIELPTRVTPGAAEAPRRARLERVEPRLERVAPAAVRERISFSTPRSSRAPRRSRAWPLAVGTLASLGLTLAALSGPLRTREPVDPRAGRSPEALAQEIAERALAAPIQPLGVSGSTPGAREVRPATVLRVPGRAGLPALGAEAISAALPPALTTPKPLWPGPRREPGPASAAEPTAPAAPPAEPAAPPARAQEPPPPPMVPVSINATPWARIEVDGRDLGITPLGGVRLSEGRHRFRAHLPDGRVVERTVDVDAYRNHIAFR
ncbi:MAG: hypothetical protein QNK04_09940 [Myxococcota bacterium]|nr:hypothetical protein [Myxococcota bacterium]